MPGLTIFGCLISSRGLCARLAASAAPTCGRVRAVHAERQGSVRLAMAGETDMQLFFYALILFGAIVGAVGGFGSSIYKDRSAQRDKAAQQKTKQRASYWHCDRTIRHARRREWRHRQSAHGAVRMGHREDGTGLHEKGRPQAACKIGRATLGAARERKSPAPWVRCGRQREKKLTFQAHNF